jgi:uncharacterized damage-inducible protein DinB
MTTPDETGFRTFPPRVADERTMYQAWLDYHRGTLLWKCAGLDAAQLKTASAQPSGLTLLGLVRHMAEVERGWFRDGWDGVEVDRIYCSDEWPDADFEDLENADVAADLATFRAECAAADEAAAARGLDDAVLGRSGKPISLRWIYVHMIEEYARHNGHADLIRERIDGETGD